MTIFTRINEIRKYIKVLMVSRIQILASVDGNKVFHFTFVFHNLWKLCVHLILLRIIYFQFILPTGAKKKKKEGDLKANLLNYHMKYYVFSESRGSSSP